MRHGTWLERQGMTREELMILAPKAVETIGDILEGDAPPNRLPASTAVLDRIGLGADVKHDFEVKGSETLAALILKLDEEEKAAAARWMRLGALAWPTPPSGFIGRLSQRVPYWNLRRSSIRRNVGRNLQRLEVELVP